MPFFLTHPFRIVPSGSGGPRQLWPLRPTGANSRADCDAPLLKSLDLSMRSRIRTSSALVIALSAVSLAFAGCGSKPERETAIVKGTVTYKGKPLSSGSIVLVPDGGGPTAQGEIGPDGAYQMGTYSLTDGAIPGTHSVMILSMTAVGGATGLPEDSLKRGSGQTNSVIPEKFADLSTSGLKVEVQSGKNTVDFELDDKAGIVKTTPAT